MRLQTRFLLCWLIVILAGLPGCFVMKVGVSNPAMNLPRIAIAPFVNLSSERSVNGRRFAEAYYTELQKVPGFQVLPVGVVESAMFDYKLNLDTPKDMRKLIEILDVDSVCFGAVTEYNPYYPPRLGLQISWYTTNMPDFQPGLPLDPRARQRHRHSLRPDHGKHSWSDKVWSCFPGMPCAQTPPQLPGFTADPVIRAQNSELAASSPPPLSAEQQHAWEAVLHQLMLSERNHSAEVPSATLITQQPVPNPVLMSPQTLLAPSTGPASVPSAESAANASPQDEITSAAPLQPIQNAQAEALALRLAQQFPEAEAYGQPSGTVPQGMPNLPPSPAAPQTQSPFGNGSRSPMALPGEDPWSSSPFPQPYMSYTRVFDGADADFTAALRNYLELSGDQRSGGWTGHLHRSEDFIRFCMHRMITEMLQLHGGESQRRYVMTRRKY